MADADPPLMPASSALQIDGFPVVELDKSCLAKHNIVALNASDDRSRAFNLFRTRLMKVLPQAGARMIGVTSATPAAGKTFVSTNLALSLAKVAEGPVILVDLDLRRGSVANELGLKPVRGVRDYLSGGVTLQDIGMRIDNLSLAILPTNPEPHESAELLSSERFSELLQSLRNQPTNTTVLFDLPPIFANDDAMLSIEHLDGFLLVIDSTVTSKAHVRQALAMLQPASCVGTVLNRYRGSMVERYGYGYGGGAYGKYYQS